ncbi:MAG: DUF2062 domain-containing protein [Thermodesulfobacteriota bacterium]
MLKNRVALFTGKIKKLHGDPHYVAFGMAIGVFIAITPTIPFHTIIAVTLALFFKASKPAAIIGVWVSNPFTVVFLYFACYKTGHLFFDDSINALETIKILINHLESDIELSQKINYFIDFIQTNIRTFMIMNFGGILLGVPSSLVAYFITKGFFVTLRQKKIAKKKAVKK